MIAYENNETDNMNKCSNNEGPHANGGLLGEEARGKMLVARPLLEETRGKMLVTSAACAHALRFASFGTSFKVMHTYWHAPF